MTVFLMAVSLFALSCEGPVYHAEPYEPLVREHPDEEDRYFNRGLGLSILGRNEDAAVAFEKAVALDENDYAASFRLGLIYLMTGQRDKAETYIERAVDGGYQHPSHGEMGLALMVLERNERAADELTLALDSDEPHPGKSIANLGTAYMRMEQYDKAVAVFERAFRDTPDVIDDYGMREKLGGAYYMAGRLEDAAGQYRAVLAENPDNAQIIRNLYIISATLGNSAEADKYRTMLVERGIEIPR